MAIETSTQPRLQRDYYIDRLRSVMTALVLLHHAAITYGGSGGWFWVEEHPSAAAHSLLLTLFLSTNQAYFMGFFFMLAGYFTPASLEKKGYGQFLKDRFLRLGLPLLFFILVLGPFTAAVATWLLGQGFWRTIQFLWQHQRIINGPLWFAQALLMFSLAYCAWRAAFGAPLSMNRRDDKPVPAYLKWLAGAVGIILGNMLIRHFVPVGVNVFGLQLGYFPGYIFLFAAGIAAWRHQWIRQLDWRKARPWIIALAIAWPCMPVAIAVTRMLNGGPGKANFSGGFSWTAIVYACWEPFVAFGAICLWLLVFRARMNQPSPVWDWLNRRAYAVYIIHPPVLVAIAILLHGWAAPALLKFAVTGTLTILACWLLSDPIVRLPGVRRIV